MFVTTTLLITFTVSLFIHLNTTEFDVEARLLSKIGMALAALAYILQSLHNFS